MTTIDPQPTVTLTSLVVEYSDGSGVIVAVPEATVCELAHVLHHTPEGEERWTDAAHYAAPWGRALRELPPAADPMDLRIRLQNVPAWRLAIRNAGESWPEGTTEWLANGTPRSEL
jgi:hypothetical protein